MMWLAFVFSSDNADKSKSYYWELPALYSLLKEKKINDILGEVAFFRNSFISRGRVRFCFAVATLATRSLFGIHKQ